MKFLTVLIGCLLMAVIPPLPAQEEGKIVTVNVPRIVEDFGPYQENVRKCKADYEKAVRAKAERPEKRARYAKLVGEWESVKKQSEDKTASKATRKEAAENLARLTKQIKDLERELDGYRERGPGANRSPDESLQIELAQVHREMREEVRSAVEHVAQQGHYRMVLQLTPKGGGLLYANPEKFPDISADVLGELRRRVEVRSRMEVISNAVVFTVGPVGAAGQPAEAEVILRDILTFPDARTQCQWLVEKGTPAGRLYGLFGLKLLDPMEWEGAERRFRDDDTKVISGSGCHRFETTTGDIAKEIAQGALNQEGVR